MSTKDSAGRLLRCGDLARLAQISADTVRYYERLGLLPSAQRTSAGYRIFPPEALVRVQLIRGAFSIGFSARELAEILQERDRGGTPCRRVRRIAAEKLAALDGRIRDLQRLRQELREALAVWDSLLAKAPRSKQSRLLEKFGTAHAQSHALNPDLRARTRENRKLERPSMKGMTSKWILAVSASAFLSFSNSNTALAQENRQPQSADQKSTANCPMMRSADSHHSDMKMNSRGEEGMGFSQTATQHHFFLTPTGGAVQVEVKDPADAANRNNIRMHLRHIAQAFANGNFDIPMFVHDPCHPESLR